MVLTTVKCPHCGSENISKNGHNSSGKQVYNRPALKPALSAKQVLLFAQTRSEYLPICLRSFS
jgi:sarcosine oxidase delta subunit